MGSVLYESHILRVVEIQYLPGLLLIQEHVAPSCSCELFFVGLVPIIAFIFIIITVVQELIFMVAALEDAVIV